MWNISMGVKDKFEKCNLLPIPESNEEWDMIIQEAKEVGEDLYARLEEELEDVKSELVQVLPNRFVPYLKNGLLNQPTLPEEVREDYLQWVREMEKEFEIQLDAAYERTIESIIDLPTTVQEVFTEGLHDSTIQRMERDEGTLHLYLNTDGAFSSKALIHLILKDIISEESEENITIGSWWIYNELQKTEEGFALRVLFDGPLKEWTITMKGMEASYYYYPSLLATLRDEEKLEVTSLTEYISQLDTRHRYWFITPDVTCEIEDLTGNVTFKNGIIEFGQNEFIIDDGSQTFRYHLDEYNPIECIYTNVYEDSNAIFDEPLPTAELETAALGNDLELQVRAWNTMYADPENLVDIINRVLLKAKVTEENEMMMSVFTSHFYQKGILSEANIKKFQMLIE